MNTQILLPKEFIFYEKLLQLISDDFYIQKSKDKYCPIDFILINKSNLQTMYIEHKFRNVDDIYDTLMIGETKIKNIIKQYNNVYLVWEFNNDVFYVRKVDKNFKKYTIENVRNSTVYMVSKSECEKYTLDDMVKFIKYSG